VTSRRVPTILSSDATACNAHAKNSAARCTAPMIGKHVCSQARGFFGVQNEGCAFIASILRVLVHPCPACNPCTHVHPHEGANLPGCRLRWPDANAGADLVCARQPLLTVGGGSYRRALHRHKLASGQWPASGLPADSSRAPASQALPSSSTLGPAGPSDVSERCRPEPARSTRRGDCTWQARAGQDYKTRRLHLASTPGRLKQA